MYTVLDLKDKTEHIAKSVTLWSLAPRAQSTTLGSGKLEGSVWLPCWSMSFLCTCLWMDAPENVQSSTFPSAKIYACIWRKGPEDNSREPLWEALGRRGIEAGPV